MPPRKPKPLKSQPDRPRNPWDIRDVEPQGDRQDRSIYEAVGKALTAWERVEVTAALIFAYLSGDRSPDYDSPAVRAFGEVISFRNRCAMVERAIQAFVHRHQHLSEYQKTIFDAVEEANKYAARRNEIAHGRLVHITDQDTGKSEGHYLLPSFFNSKKFSLQNLPAYQYTSKDILHYRDRFDIMSQRLFAIYRLLKHEPLEQSLLQETERSNSQDQDQKRSQ